MTNSCRSLHRDKRALRALAPRAAYDLGEPSWPLSRHERRPCARTAIQNDDE